MKRRAFITGITGQDGSYLAELLIEKDYEVYGLVRNVALEDSSHRLLRISGILDRIKLETGSIENYPRLYRLINQIKPDEIYHLDSQSFVSYDFDDDFSSLSTNVNCTHYLLSCIKELIPMCRFYFAGSSGMFGTEYSYPQKEETPFNPRSLYGISKTTSFHLTKSYRDRYNLFACSGILFNHESTRRGFEFVIRKITSHVAKIKLGLADKLFLGNLKAQRDWGHAKDYVKAMWLMLNQVIPEDYLISSGKTYRVEEFCEKAFSFAGLDYKKYVFTDEKFYRPSESVPLVGDSSKACGKLQWKQTISFDLMIQEMVNNDLALLRKV